MSSSTLSSSTPPPPSSAPPKKKCKTRSDKGIKRGPKPAAPAPAPAPAPPPPAQPPEAEEEEAPDHYISGSDTEPSDTDDNDDLDDDDWDWDADQEQALDPLTEELKCQDCKFEEWDGDGRNWRPPPSDLLPRRCGPKGFDLANFDPTPLSVTRRFLRKDILTEVAKASTEYAGSCEPERKTPPEYTHEDIMSWVLANVMMGLVQMPEIDDYFVADTLHPTVKALTGNRAKFKALSKDLHCVNTNKFTQAEQKVKSQENSFWKLGNFPSRMSDVFGSLRCPHCALTVDEFTIPFKGRHRARCFNPNKPCKYHLKGFALNEALSG